MKLEFESNGLRLAALLDAPESAPLAYAVFAPCFTCNKNIKTAAYLGKALTEHGIATLRFDFAGLGESQGDFMDNTLSSNIADIISAADFLAKNYTAPALLLGHSFGGVAAIRAGAKIESVRAVVTVNSPSDPHHLTTAFPEKLPEIHAAGHAMVNIVGRPFPITRLFLEDVETHRNAQAISDLKKPLLICHAANDDVVPFSEAEAAFAAASQPKSILSLGNAGHYLFDRRHAEGAAGMIAAWVKMNISV